MISNKATVTSLKYKQGVKTNIVTTHELTCLQGATVTRLTLTRQMTCQDGVRGVGTLHRPTVRVRRMSHVDEMSYGYPLVRGQVEHR